jgi:type VI secretion system secreted protein VgrG
MGRHVHPTHRPRSDGRIHGSDPDHPIITGRVYNAEMMPPYALPANQTQSGIKSRSSKGGSPDNFNEIRFGDKKGNEEIYLHGEKNWTINIENDKAQWVGHDEELTVDNNRTKKVGVDQSEGLLSKDNHPPDVEVDSEALTLSANREIVIRCGEASITLTRAGKILVKGKYLLGRSSGVNRIKGGSVQIH